MRFRGKEERKGREQMSDVLSAPPATTHMDGVSHAATTRTGEEAAGGTSWVWQRQSATPNTSSPPPPRLSRGEESQKPPARVLFPSLFLPHASTVPDLRVFLRSVLSVFRPSHQQFSKAEKEVSWVLMSLSSGSRYRGRITLPEGL